MEQTQVPQWTLGDRLRKAREPMTQTAIAFQLGKKPSTIGHWESGLHRPGLLELERWAEITGTPLWWLLGYDEDPGRHTILAAIKNRWPSEADSFHKSAA